MSTYLKRRKGFTLALMLAFSLGFIFIMRGFADDSIPPISQQGVEEVGVWPIARPVAGVFPCSLYFYRFRPGTHIPNISGGGSTISGEYGSAANNFAQTITWAPLVENVFMPNTEYTATLRLSPVNSARTFENFPLEIAENLRGLPFDGVRDISARHDGHELLIEIAFVATDDIQVAERIFHEDFSAAYGFDLGEYFIHVANDNNRAGLSSWRDNTTFVRTSETPGVGNELVVSFWKDPSLAPAGVSQAHVNNWIRAGGASTRNRSAGTVNRGNSVTFENAYGFYEAAIQFDSIRGTWGAFWLMGFQVHFFQEHAEAHGAIGSEIDIVETFDSWRPPAYRGPNGFNHAWHWNGYGAHHRSAIIQQNSNELGVNIYDGDFHVFGFEWSSTYYIFFLNGVEIARHRDGERSRIAQNPCHLRFTIEAAPWAGGRWEDGRAIPYVAETSGEFRVDYVSVWNGPRPNIISLSSGDGSMEFRHVVRGESYQLTGNEFTRQGYRIADWNTCPDGNGEVFVPTGVVATSSNIVDISLYARWEPINIIPGDVNGDGVVTAADVGLLRAYLAGFPVEIIRAAADVNGDGEITMADVGLIRAYLAGFPVELRVSP